MVYTAQSRETTQRLQQLEQKVGDELGDKVKELENKVKTWADPTGAKLVHVEAQLNDAVSKLATAYDSLKAKVDAIRVSA